MTKKQSVYEQIDRKQNIGFAGLGVVTLGIIATDISEWLAVLMVLIGAGMMIYSWFAMGRVVEREKNRDVW